MVPRLRELFRQVEAEVVSNSRNKILQTWGPFLSHPFMQKTDLIIVFGQVWDANWRPCCSTSTSASATPTILTSSLPSSMLSSPYLKWHSPSWNHTYFVQMRYNYCEGTSGCDLTCTWQFQWLFGCGLGCSWDRRARSISWQAGLAAGIYRNTCTTLYAYTWWSSLPLSKTAIVCSSNWLHYTRNVDNVYILSH